MYTNRHVETTIFEVTIFLAQSAHLAAKVNETIVAGGLRKGVLASHLGPVEARVHARAPRHQRDQSV